MIRLTATWDLGMVSYHCRTPRGALEKLAEYRGAQYEEIRIVQGVDTPLTPEQLIALAERDEDPHPVATRPPG